VVLQGIPGDFVFEIVEEKTAVVYTSELVFEDQARGILAHILEKIE
jgi:hypothetical protein